MSSINTNLSAITALQSLKATQTAMNKNQNQISTGLRVGEASHNASYWSISTKMKSDNGALGAVKDSLKQSKEMINTFSGAMEKSLGFLNTMKTKLAAGSNPGADLKAIQTELKSSIEGLKSIAASATFNGQNWLKADGETVKLVTSYDGQAKELKFLDIDTSKINLFAKTTGGADILGTAGTSGVAVDDIDISDAAQASTLSFTLKTGTFGGTGVGTGTSTVTAGDVIRFSVGTGNEQTFVVDKTMNDMDDLVEAINKDSTLNTLVEARKVTAREEVTTGVFKEVDRLVLSSKVDGSNVVGGYYNGVAAPKTTTAAAVGTAGAQTFDFSAAGSLPAAGSVIRFRVEGGEEKSYTVAGGDTTATILAASLNTAWGAGSVSEAANVITFAAPAPGAGVMGKNVQVSMTAATSEEGAVKATAAKAGSGTSVANALKSVDEAINKITEGMSMLGANKALIESQEDFIGVLSDSLTAGVSAFVDADMNEVSTRNQALQTQQQLGVQALSMANQNSQMILKLFQ
ncbi:flagellin [Microvirga terrestris]|uniref:Flagellin n=1 Tax=Microvirga terrestris TaxID=2791024 RepID=A0ABS0HQU8_9HYPH|nr:flagellin [Microvirga terrestris]MBF9195862.1 flagellin [Microvirga terrestris]